MAPFGLITHFGIFVGGYDITGIANNAQLQLSADVKDRTVFGNTAKVRGLGLEDILFSAAGLLDPAKDVNQIYWGTAAVPVSFFQPATSGSAVAVGDRAFFFEAVNPSFQVGGQHGEDAVYAFAGRGSGNGHKVGIGRVLNPCLVAVTADGNGTGYQEGAVASGQYLYAILHVTEISAGDSVVVTIESAPTDDFASPTTRVTFASKSAVGGEYATRVAGPITDTYWRAVHNVTGTDVSIKYAAAIAIR